MLVYRCGVITIERATLIRRNAVPCAFDDEDCAKAWVERWNRTDTTSGYWYVLLPGVVGEQEGIDNRHMGRP